MNSENLSTRGDGNSRTSNAPIAKAVDAMPKGTVITLASILKFFLFFTACLAVATLLVGWYLGYFQ
jgi:hypothetical protein